MTVADLRTARLTLRGLRESDTEAAVEVFAASEMSAHYDFSEPRVRAMVRKRLDGRYPPGMGNWVVEHDGAVIGLVGGGPHYGGGPHRVHVALPG